MKKVILIVLAMVSVVQAKEYTQVDRILDMQKMAHAMQDIQTGFFYNNIDVTKAGIEDLLKAVDNIRPTKEELENKDIYEKWLNQEIKMTNKIKKVIRRRTNTILERFSSGDAVQAQQAYNSISDKCMKCHIRVRKW